MVLFAVEHNKILLVLWNITAKRIPESYTGLGAIATPLKIRLVLETLDL